VDGDEGMGIISVGDRSKRYKSKVDCDARHGRNVREEGLLPWLGGGGRD